MSLFLDMGLGNPGVRTAPQAAPGNVAAAAFGPSYGAATKTQGSLLSIFKPDDAFGVTHLVGVLAVVGLIWLRYSLPGS